MTEHTSPPKCIGAAVAGEGLYLLNLLFPGLPLLVLAWLYFRKRKGISLYLNGHLIQPLIAGIISTCLFIIINLVAAVSGGYSSLDNLVSIHSLVALEVYILLVALPFIVPGLLGLTKAMAGQSYRYPFLGRFL